MFIQEITQNTPKDVIRSRRDPVTKMEKVIENKHDSHSKDRIYDPDYDKFQHRLVK